MSEDVDLKVVLAEDHGLSRSGIRTNLSDLKKSTIAEMEKLGFVQDPAGLRAKREPVCCDDLAVRISLRERAQSSSASEP
jgi:hypothetical protein